MSYDFIVSAGGFCQTAHQVRRITKSNVTSIFDWVLTPHEGLIDSIETNFANFFKKEYLAPNQGRIGVINTKLGLEFWHDFSPQGGMVEQETLDREYAALKKKYDLLADHWNERLSEGSNLVVRQCDRPAAHIAALRESLTRRYPAAQIDLMVIRPMDAPLDLTMPNLFVRTVAPGPKGENEWLGDDASWSAAFASIGVLPRAA